MVRSRNRFFLFTCLIIIALLVLLSPVSAVTETGSVSKSAGTCSITSCLGLPLGTGVKTTPVQGPVSKTYVPPPGIMPVIVLQGSPYEMGYQYGLAAPEYIAITRDAAWATALSKNSYAEIRDNCSISQSYISSELTAFDFPAFFLGMSDAMNDQGISFSPVDPIVMSYYGGRGGPVPEEHCTAFAAYGNVTNRGMIAGVNFDYFQVPANSYEVLLAMYPENGYPALIPAGAGRLGSNAVVNEKGLVYFLSTAPSDGKGDLGPGISGFLEIPYVGMTAATVPEAEQELLSMTRGFSLNRLLADTSGNAEVLEATRVRSAIRSPDNGSYLIATNHYRNPVMKPSQKIWDAEVYYPSTYYRYITVEKEIRNNTGNFNFGNARNILSLRNWWDGKQWHMNDPWSTNTINRFRSDNVASTYSLIALPEENIVSVCTGNPGMPYWGARAAGQTGTYINYTISKKPETMVYRLRTDADAGFWKTLQVLGNNPDPDIARRYAAAEDRYWEAVWWHNRGVLENDRTAQAVAFGKSATGFSDVIASLGEIQSLCRNMAKP
ncbi:C45 family autoproteolytic acyltransferase/hydolase [Methanoregula sp.]|uniref:C45 family autoproteolytic acyltransferase/hydolase n=1 Tax=Methanoregula sp. TaxID=2052170 RepID=UPI0035696874